MSHVQISIQQSLDAVTNPGQEERVEQIIVAISHSFKTKKRDFELT